MIAPSDIMRLPGGQEWIILGDLNAHHEWWDNIAARDQRGEWVTEWAEAKRLSVLNDGEVTRVERGTGRTSTPDVSVCHEDRAGLCRWQVHRALGSDHFPVVINIGTRPDTGRGKEVMVWSWKNADWSSYQEEVGRRLPKESEGMASVKELEECVRKVILKAAWRHVGMKKLRTGNGEFLNAEVRKELERRDELKRNWPEQVDQVEDQEKKVRKMMRERKAELWKTAISKHSSHGKMWSLLHKLEGRQHKEDAKVLKHRDKGYGSDKAKANAFASEYAAVSKVIVPKWARRMKAMNAAVLRSRSGPDTCDSQEITLEEVRRALTKMDGGKAAGPDLIHPPLLKQLPGEALSVVRRLFNLSYAQGSVPQAWRTARIVPLLKKGKDSSEISSYRPVSLTSTMGKWLERILTDRLSFVLEKSGQLSQFQAGFRQNRSVEDQLL